MSTIEFEAIVKDGRISIPQEYRNKVNGNVRVILLAEGTAEGFDMIEHLLANPLSIEGFKPLTREEVYEQQ
jgi:hypothetical protein